MKKILFAALLMITSIAAFSQEQPQPIQHNQFADYVQFQREHQRPEFRPHHFPMHPKPERVIVKGDKVIVIFNKADFQRLRPEVIERERVIFKDRPRTKFHEFMIEKFNN